MKYILTLILCLFSTLIFAQLPANNIYVFDMEASATRDVYRFTKPKLINGNNLGGYNNQPQFIKGQLYISSQRDGKQTDIYKFNIDRKMQTQITQTAESEYSPTPMPDGQHISVVRVSADGLDNQQLWKIPMNGGEAELMLNDIAQIGYHEWISESMVALFIVGEPHTLFLVDTETGDIRQVRSDIGRCLRMNPDGKLTFVHKSELEGWYIKSVNPRNSSIRPIIKTLPESEDFAWGTDGTLYMAKGSKLYRFNSGLDNDWRKVADFSNYGIKNIQRIAVSRNRIALVDVKK